MNATEWTAANLYRYRATVTRVVDGDTLVATVALGFDVSHDVHLRLAGVNAPELTGPDRAAGQAAKAWLTDRALGKTVFVQTFRDRRSFTRYVASVLLADDNGTLTDLTSELIAAGLAVPTDSSGHTITTGAST